MAPGFNLGNFRGLGVNHLAVDLTPGLTPGGPHEALVEAGVLGGRVLDEQGREVVVKGDLDPFLVLVDGPAVVEELELRFVSGGKLEQASENFFFAVVDEVAK
jgi:hypothetical protein